MHQYSIRMAEGVAFLYMRQLRDLYNNHMAKIMPKDSPKLRRCKALIKECDKRKILDVANLIVAHYAKAKYEVPLAEQEVQDLIVSNGWSSHKEVVDWIGTVTADLFAVLCELKLQYKITDFDQEKE